MSRTDRIAAALLLICLALPARAETLNTQPGAKDLQSSCKAELPRFCPGNATSVQSQASCLHNYYVGLSLSCRSALKRRATPKPGETPRAGRTSAYAPL